LARLRSYPTKKAVAQFAERTVLPALQDVAKEFTSLGYEAELTTTPNEETDIDEYTLVVNMDDHRNFHYQVAAVEAPVPTFGGRSMPREIDTYYRLEVFTQTGTEGYDLMGLTQQQVINDVLDRYEAHLGFLNYSSEHDYASILTPRVPPTTESIPLVPKMADDVQKVDE
jgi:choline/glycine/proline betaine transport protein